MVRQSWSTDQFLSVDPFISLQFQKKSAQCWRRRLWKTWESDFNFFYSPIHETYNPYFISCLIELDCESLLSELEEALGSAYAQQFSKRGEAADRLRNILNKYKQGSNCKYDSILCIINDSCLAWLIFRYHECTYLNNWLVRNSDEVSHVFLNESSEMSHLNESSAATSQNARDISAFIGKTI